MGRLSAHQHQRLEALGIDVWLPRHGSDGDQPLRIRLASGKGRWALVQRQPWRGEFQALLADITATLGADQCRFGQWTKSADAGIGVSELSQHGIQRVLSFGPPPIELDEAHVIEMPTMQALHDDPEARKTFWQTLKPHR